MRLHANPALSLKARGRMAEQVLAQRRLRSTTPELADLLGMPVSTISGVPKRIGMGKLGRLGLEPPLRYQRDRPGELIHIDVKKLGRIHGGAGHRVTGRVGQRFAPLRTDPAGVRRGTAGWDAVHVAVDDTTRLAYIEVLGDEKASTAVAFLRGAIAFYARHGITVERVITDNGSPTSPGCTPSLAARLALGICAPGPTDRRPTARPKRFIRTTLNGWAYGAIYRSSDERTAALDGWLDHYNHHRPHQPSAENHPSPA